MIENNLNPIFFAILNNLSEENKKFFKEFNSDMKNLTLIKEILKEERTQKELNNVSTFDISTIEHEKLYEINNYLVDKYKLERNKETNLIEYRMTFIDNNIFVDIHQNHFYLVFFSDYIYDKEYNFSVGYMTSYELLNIDTISFSISHKTKHQEDAFTLSFSKNLDIKDSKFELSTTKNNLSIKVDTVFPDHLNEDFYNNPYLSYVIPCIESLYSGNSSFSDHLLLRYDIDISKDSFLSSIYNNAKELNKYSIKEQNKNKIKL